MIELLWIILATFINGLVALLGVFTLGLKKESLEKVILGLVAFSAGALLSGGLFHLASKSLQNLTSNMTFGILIGGFTLFFVMEKFLHWHHCHEQEDDCPHPFTYLILIGDGLHNFIDGLVIAASFLVNASFGAITTILIIGHEIPQELGDFGVLLHGGMKKKKALFYNFISQLTAVVGGIIGFFIGSQFTQYLIPLAAGGFVYIAASDLIPEIRKENKIKDIVISFLLFFVGIGFMLALKLILG